MAVMSRQQTISEIIAKKLTCPDQQYGVMTRYTSTRPSRIRRVSARSSLGVFDNFPAELWLIILDLLDFQSLSRISRVSLLGKVVVESLPAYKDLMTYAPEALPVLGRCQVLSYHPASLLRRTLRSSQCVSCSEFGAFLFLPTFERVCFICLTSNPAFWMTTPVEILSYE